MSTLKNKPLLEFTMLLSLPSDKRDLEADCSISSLTPSDFRKLNNLDNVLRFAESFTFCAPPSKLDFEVFIRNIRDNELLFLVLSITVDDLSSVFDSISISILIAFF